MPVDGAEQPFDSIESAQEFMNVFAEMVLDAMAELKSEHTRALDDSDQRRARAIELAQYKLKVLICYTQKNRRALNDLRIIRRLILNERATAQQMTAAM